MALSPIFAILRSTDRGVVAGPAGVSAVQELSQLADLLEKGLVDRHEFDRLKGDILARMPGGS